MRKYLVVIIVFALVAFSQVYAPLPGNLKGVNRDVNSFLQTVPQLFTYTHTGLTVEDTLLTNLAFKNKIWIEDISIVVTDTVETQGDSCYFKVWLGSDKIFDNKTSTFKLPGGFLFTPTIRVLSSTNSRVYVGIANTTSGQTTGITEGAFKLYIRYWNL